MPAKQDIAVVVAEATVLARQIKADLDKLDGLKALIRTHAEKVTAKRGDDEKVEIASPEGTCTVVFPSDSTVLKDGADPYMVQDLFPEPVWEHLFVEKVGLAPNFWARIASLPKVFKFNMNNKGRKALEEMLEKKPNAPRVTLAK